MPSTAMHTHNLEYGETLKNGHKDFAAAGVAEPLVATNIRCKEVLVQAKQGNAGAIYLGGPGVPNDGTGGVFLTAGQSMPFSAARVGDIYGNAENDGEGVSFIYW